MTEGETVSDANSRSTTAVQYSDESAQFKRRALPTLSGNLQSGCRNGTAVSLKASTTHATNKARQEEPKLKCWSRRRERTAQLHRHSSTVTNRRRWPPRAQVRRCTGTAAPHRKQGSAACRIDLSVCPRDGLAAQHCTCTVGISSPAAAAHVLSRCNRSNHRLSACDIHHSSWLSTPLLLANAFRWLLHNNCLTVVYLRAAVSRLQPGAASASNLACRIL